MVKAKDKHNKIEFGGDEDMSFYDNGNDFGMEMDDSGLDLDSEFGSKNRNPVVRTGKILKDAAVNSLTDDYFIRSTIDEKLPKEVGSTIKHFDQIGAGVNKVYDEVSKNLKPGLDSATKTLRQVISKDSRVVPNWLNDKLTELSDNISASQQKSVEADRNDFIGAQLQELMTQSAEQANTLVMADMAERAKDRTVETDRFNMSSTMQQQMNQSLVSLDSYHKNFHAAFAKKSLEVSYRSLFVLQDILAQNRDATKAQLEQLASISKNTALPDYVKYRGIEVTKELIQRKMTENTIDPIVRRASDITHKLFGNLTKAFGDKARDISDNITSGTDMLAMLKDLADTDEDEFKDQVGSGILGMLFGGKLKNQAKRAVGHLVNKFENSQYYKPTMRFVRKTNDNLNNASHRAQNLLNDQKYLIQRLRASELEVEDHEKLMELAKRFDSGDKDLMTQEEIDRVVEFKKKNFASRKLTGVGNRLKRSALNFVDQYGDTITEGVVDKRNVVDYTQLGAANHFTRSEDLMASKKRVDETIIKVIPKYLQSILKEVSSIRMFGTKNDSGQQAAMMHFDWDSGQLTTQSKITAKIRQKAYDPKKAAKLRESLARMITAGGPLSNEAAQSLTESIMDYWQSEGSSKMGSSIGLFTEDYFKAKKAGKDTFSPLHPEAENWLATVVGDKPSSAENAARRTRKTAIDRFEQVQSYWDEAVQNRVDIDPRNIYKIAREVGYEHNHIAEALNISQKDGSNFLGDTKYEMDIGRDNDTIKSMLGQVSYSQASKDFTDADKAAKIKLDKENEEARRLLEDERARIKDEKLTNRIRRQTGIDKIITPSAADENDYRHKNTDPKRKPNKQKRAAGGPVLSAQQDGVDTDKALTLGKDVVLAGGEHVFTDKEVKLIGGGSIEEGHRRLIVFRNKIKAGLSNMKDDTIHGKLVNGFSKAAQYTKDNLSAAAHIESMQLQSKSIKKHLDEGYKLDEQEVQEFAQTVSSLTGMSSQAVALAMVYANTDTLANHLAKISKMADIEQIKKSVDNIANDSYQVKNIITAKDKVSTAAQATYQKAKTKFNSGSWNPWSKTQEPSQPQEQVQSEDDAQNEKVIKHKRLSNNRREHYAAVERDKLNAKRKVEKTSEFLTGNRQMRELQASLDNAQFVGDKATAAKLQKLLKDKYGVQTTADKFIGSYDKLLDKIKNRDEKAEISHRDLGAAIREYLQACDDGKYIDYRANRQIAQLLSKEIANSNPEMIAHMLDWSMYTSLLELLEHSIPFRGEQTVRNLYNAIEELYNKAMPLAKTVKDQLEAGQPAPMAKYFTVTANNALKDKSTKVNAAVDSKNTEFQEFVDACKDFVSAYTDQVKKQTLYKKVSKYTGIGLDKVKGVLDTIKAKQLAHILTPKDGPKKLLDLLDKPRQLLDFVKSTASKVIDKTPEGIKNSKMVKGADKLVTSGKQKVTNAISQSSKAISESATQLHNDFGGTHKKLYEETIAKTEQMLNAAQAKIDKSIGIETPQNSNKDKVVTSVQEDFSEIKKTLLETYISFITQARTTGQSAKELGVMNASSFKAWSKNKTVDEIAQYANAAASVFKTKSIAAAVQVKKVIKTNVGQLQESKVSDSSDQVQSSFKDYVNAEKKIIDEVTKFNNTKTVEPEDNDGFEQADIYMRGSTDPVMTYKDIVDGYFIDAKTGKTIAKASDITGDIIDVRTGEVAVYAKDLGSLVHIRVDRTKTGHGGLVRRGLLSRFIPIGTHASKLMGSRIGAIMRGQYGAWDLIKDVALMPFKAVDFAVKFALDRPADIYISDGDGGTLGEPILTKKKMKDGHYFNANGEPIYTPAGIKGIVVDQYGDIVIDKSDLKKGLCFKNGKKIEGPWTRVLKRIASIAFAPAKWALKGTWWLTKKANKAAGWMLGKGAKGLFNLQRDKGSIEETQIEIEIFSSQQLAAINENMATLVKTQQEQIKESKKPRAGSWREKLFGKKKEEPKATDKPGQPQKEKSSFAKAMDFIKEWGPLILGGALLIGPAIMKSDFGQIVTKIGSGVHLAAKGIYDVATWFKEKGTAIFNNIDKLSEKVFGVTTSTGTKVGLTAAAAGLGTVALAKKYIPKAGAIGSMIKTLAGVVTKMPGGKWVAIGGIMYTLASIFGDDDSAIGSTTQAGGQGSSDGYTPVGSNGKASSNQDAPGMDASTAVGAAMLAGSVGKMTYDKFKPNTPVAANTGNVFEQYAKDMGKPGSTAPELPADGKPGLGAKLADKASSIKDAVASKAKHAVASTALAADIATGGKVSKAAEALSNAGSKAKGFISPAASKVANYLPSASTVGNGLTKFGNYAGKLGSFKTQLILQGASFAVDQFADKDTAGGKSAMAAADIAANASTGAMIGSAIPIPGVGTAIGVTLGTAYGLWKNRESISAIFSQKSDLDQKSIRAVRYAGYGFVGSAANAMHPGLFTLESKCSENIEISNVTSVSRVNVNNLNLDDVCKVLGLDPSKAESKQAADTWFLTRFKPVFEAHYNALLKTIKITKEKAYNQFDDIDSQTPETKSKYITLVLSSISKDIPTFDLIGSSLIAKTTLTSYDQIVAAHKSYSAPVATNDKAQNKTVKEGITQLSTSTNEAAMAGYKPRRSYDPSEAGSSVNVNIPAARRTSISVAGAEPRQKVADSIKKAPVAVDPSKSTIVIGYGATRGTTDYGPTGDPNSYISGTARIKDNADPVRAASGIYSTQKVYNPMKKDGDDVLEDVEYYDKDITEESKPTAQAERGEAPANLFSAKGGLYTGNNARNFIVFGKDPNGFPIDLEGLVPEFKQLLFGCIEEYGSRTGKTVQINSAYRSASQQASLKKRFGDKAAPAGSSPHEFGFAVDMNTADIDAMEKLGLMRKYGLCRPLSAESWHVEPIGIQLDYYKCKQDRLFARKMIAASPGRGGSGPGDTMRGKQYKVRRVTAMLKEIWEKPQMYIPEDNQYASVKPAVKDTKDGVMQVGFSTGSQAQKQQSPVVKTADTDVEKPSPAVAARRTSYANGVDQAQAAVNAQTTEDWRRAGTGVDSLKDFTVKGKSPADVKAAITEASKAFGMDPDIPLVIAQVESSMGKSNSTSTSTEKGIFQFTDATWKDATAAYIKEHGPDAGISKDSNPLDHRSNILVGLNFLKKRLEGGANVHDLYLMHLLGETGHRNFKAGIEQGKLPAQAASAAAVKANTNLFYEDDDKNKPFTTEQFRENLFRDKFVKAAAAAGLSKVPGSSGQSISDSKYMAQASKSQSAPDGIKRVSMASNSEVDTRGPRDSQRRSAPSTKVLNYVPETPSVDTDKPVESSKAAVQVRAAAKDSQFSIDPVKKVLEDSYKVHTEHLEISKQILGAIKEQLQLSKETKGIEPGNKNKSPEKLFEPKSKTVATTTIPAPSEFPASTVSTSRNTYESVS